MKTVQNFYKETITIDCTAVVGKIYVSTLPTPTDGWLVISPNDASKREIIEYSGIGTDTSGNYVTSITRGVGGTSARAHSAGEYIRMNITAEYWADMTSDIQQVATDLSTAVISGASPASTTSMGIVRSSYSPDATIGTATITIASPGVVTFASHGLTANDIVKFTTTGTLPTGIVAGTTYFVSATGLTTNTFSISATLGGTRINTTGSQSGVHTLYKATPVAIVDTDPRVITTAEKSRIPSVSTTDALVGNYGTPSGTNKFVTSQFLFGGTGADGSLSITTGTTTLDLVGAEIFVKNYSSISITGTGVLAFINPNANGTKIILKSVGSVTLTSSATPMIDASGLGASGGAGVSGTVFANIQNVAGTIGKCISGLLQTNPGTSSATAVSTAGGAPSISFPTTTSQINSAYLNLLPGAGGASGSGSSNNVSGSASGTTGSGGRGGGVLVIECGGSFNFTTTNGISVAGKNGGNGTNVGGNDASWRGGGGGGGGTFLCFYNTLTANTGTVNISGGTGGNTAIPTVGAGGAGYNTNGGGGGGGSASAGTNGTATNNAAKSGGDGGLGLSQILASII